jgi:hypothetical protein
MSMPLERWKLGKSMTRLSPKVLLQIHICKVMMVSCSAHVQKLDHYEMAAEALTRNTDFQAVNKHTCNGVILPLLLSAKSQEL